MERKNNKIMMVLGIILLAGLLFCNVLNVVLIGDFIETKNTPQEPAEPGKIVIDGTGFVLIAILIIQIFMLPAIILGGIWALFTIRFKTFKWLQLANYIATGVLLLQYAVTHLFIM